ncbi:urease accessory protein UreF [Histoplasma capsulatum var. duboisii H88]|uniref:Urease accessory protein UreF n=1 Tax=Ajellomyces capsulatus (strain H88) TaxID=544711 RepID=F0UR57_AJEC8|nr:urease accessory protein UreF [Histoplasma capsulatum var. duboisii H88]QSS50406.1 urease accessory protein UreF [Histoplasma capsulatum var. duboisii H88]
MQHHNASESNVKSIQEEIYDLERRLEDAKQRLNRAQEALSPTESLSPPGPGCLSIPHALLLLSDSALPLGAFAYSSGLESYLAHNKQSQSQSQSPSQHRTSQIESFHLFLSFSLASLASTTLPYVLTAHRQPDQLETLDNDLDASTPCTVTRRASIAQGLALLSAWERAFRDAYTSRNGNPTADTKTNVANSINSSTNPPTPSEIAITALSSFSATLKTSFPNSSSEPNNHLNGHLPPLWAVVCVAMDIDITSTAYVYMLNHAKAVLSAAVRASVMGPYQAQAVLASRWLREVIEWRIRTQWTVPPEEAGQVVPTIDLWVGRHELLYSRIFNS